MNRQSTPPSCRGFTLTELAVVLVIVALLIGGMLMPLSAQNDLLYASQTQKTLNDVRDALLGYAAANGRLPCPARPGTSGVESSTVLGNGICTDDYDGFVPAITLGITPTDGNGYAIDGWGNAIRYAVFPQAINDPSANPINHPFTVPGGMKTVTLAQLANYTASTGLNKPLLSVCACGAAVTSPGDIVNAACSTSMTVCSGSPGKITDQAVAVIYSLGKNASTGGTGAGEKHNPNPNSGVAPDPAFVSHIQTQAGSADGEFDDLVIWVSPNVLYNRMIAAGVLP
jgi:prepilin-type N-terminal cleavage/methylation domain-containing protein